MLREYLIQISEATLNDIPKIQESIRLNERNLSYKQVKLLKRISTIREISLMIEEAKNESDLSKIAEDIEFSYHYNFIGKEDVATLMQIIKYRDSQINIKE